jgi:exodeoxyribonuclease III
MKIATFNTNSVRTRKHIITDWLEKEKPDLLCLQETKVQDKDFPSDTFEPAGYQVIFRGQKSYNGVAIISRHPMSEVLKDLYPEGDEQARFISAIISDVRIINVYVPQGNAVGTDKFSYKLQWMKDLLSHIKREYNPTSNLILTGDFNVAMEPIDLYNPDGFKGEVGYHPDEQAIMRDFFDWGLIDVFRKHHEEGGNYTFWDYRIPNGFKRNMGWRIDYILTTSQVAQKSVNAWIDTGPRALEKPSDHTFLVAEFDF